MKKPSKALIAKWYAKAAKAGFEEAEDTEPGKDRLKRWHSHYWQSRFTELTFGARQDYYRLAVEYTEHGEFETGAHKKIWAAHATGLPIREIAEKLKTNGSEVHKVISKYRKHICKS